MKYYFPFLIIFLLSITNVHGQKKNKKKNERDRQSRIMEVYGDSLRTDSIVYYETEVGYIMPDLSQKFNGKWEIKVMRRQARAEPDSLDNSYLEFNEDTLFTAYVGCNKLSGTYIIKGPTIKFNVKNSALSQCDGEIEEWFITLIEDRVSYFGVDEKVLYLKDVAFNIVFDCTKLPGVKQ
jgi:heat shock protein HslJ